MTEMIIKPVAYIRSATKAIEQMPVHGVISEIVIEAEYLNGLKNIELNSHLWILSWFHQARRDVLVTSPKKIDHQAGEYGVFALRTPMRPNPIALTLVRLLGIDGNVLTVSGLDGIDGTPVLDIKPYFEKDSVFAPVTPYIRPSVARERWKLFYELAINYHGEDCVDLRIALEMALAAEDRIGRLTDEAVTLHVQGSCCLFDVLQILTKAKVGKQGRISHEQSNEVCTVIWRKDDDSFKTSCTQFIDEEEVCSRYGNILISED